MSKLQELEERVEDLEKENEVIFSLMEDAFPPEKPVYHYTINYERPKTVSTWST